MLKDLRIQKKLLEYYTENYAKMPNTRDEAIEFLSRKNMHMGLCASSYFVFSQRISRRKWLKRECKYGNLWYALPNIGKNIDEVRDCLTYRIAKLEGIIDRTPKWKKILLNILNKFS